MNGDDQYGERETERRRDAIIKNMIATPPKQHKPLKAKKKLKRNTRAVNKQAPREFRSLKP